MSNRSSTERVLHYQVFAMVGLVLLVSLSIFAYFLSKNLFNNEQRLRQLEQDIRHSQQANLETEVHSVLQYLSYMRQRAEEVLKKESKNQVEQALSIARTLQRQHPQASRSELEGLIRETLRDIRFFSGRGYLFIDDLAGNCVLLPTAPHLEGQSLLDNQDDSGHYIMRGLLDAVDNPEGAGYSRYRWYAPGNNQQMRDKISYVARFEPLDWIIGTGDYIFQIENDLKLIALERLKRMRFGMDGYISVLDQHGQLLVNIGDNALLGQNYQQLRSKELKQNLENILMQASQGGGILEHSSLLSEQPGQPRLSLITTMEEWGWVIVAGINPSQLHQLIAKQRQELQADFRRDTQHLLLVMGVALLLTLVLALAYSAWLRRQFKRYQLNIEHQHQRLRDNAHQLEVAARVFEAANEGILITDARNKIIACNASFTEITGYSREEVLGQDPSILSSGKHDAEFYQQLWQDLTAHGHWQGEIYNRRKNGTIYPEWLSITLYKDAQGKVLNFIASIADISGRKKVEARLRYLAEYDPLTNLPNRRLLEDRANQLIQISRRHPERKLALLFIDLDRFKTINDSLGHRSGDKLLQAMAQRLRHVARSCDTVSRIGGDEFIVLMHDLDIPEAAAKIAHRLQQAISMPVDIDGHRIITTPSIGIACHPEDGESFEELMRNADAALYQAKHLGRNNFQFYTQSLNAHASEYLQLQTDLHEALAYHQLLLHYQPQFDLASGQLQGCEALVRWQHPSRGMVSPGVFIPLAEESGLIHGIGQFVLQEACRQGAAWLNAGLEFGNIAVNLSASQFSTDLVDWVASTLKQTGMPATRLTLEVTESMLMEDANIAAAVLAQLKQLGVSIALDDFGTGYSSLAYLKGFALDKLKIDKAFIDNLPSNQDDAAITRAIIDIARHLQLQTVAEGIEHQAQWDFLRQVGCDAGQGYLYARPLTPAQLEERLKHPPSA